MTVGDDKNTERGGDDLLAAEYVAGVLSTEERQAVAERIGRDAAFALLVDRWEAHFAPLADAYAPVEAPASVKQAIDRALFSSPSADRSGTSRAAGLWSSLAFWRGLAVAALAVLAVYIAIPYVNPPAATPPVRLVASLAAAGSDVKYLAVYDPANDEVGLSHVSGDRETGKDFELWMIEGDRAPVSIGVIPVGSTIHLTISESARKKLARGAVLAVSLEPKGGSPTGQPTGPVVAAGDLRDI